jgi:hypothetical protein
VPTGPDRSRTVLVVALLLVVLVVGGAVGLALLLPR